MRLKGGIGSLPLAIFVVGLLVGCNGEGGGASAGSDAGSSGEQAKKIALKCEENDTEDGLTRPAGWNYSSHCKFATGNLDVVFPLDNVRKLSIKISPEDFSAMEADLADLLPENGGGVNDVVAGESSSAANGGPSGEEATGLGFGYTPTDLCEDRVAGDACYLEDATGSCKAFDGKLECVFEGGFGGGLNSAAAAKDPCGELTVGALCVQGDHEGHCGKATDSLANGPLICEVDEYDDASGVDSVPVEAAASFADRKPIYVRAEVTFEGETFTSVGIRYKGNSSLSATARKKPLRLKMDEWEDENPEITDQRLFGFQALSFSPNNTDSSNLHQVLAAATFRDHGVPAPHSSFVEIFLDTGDGSELLGLYAVTEIPDKPLLDRFFGNHDGNLYKPDGRGAHLVSLVKESFHKKSRAPSDLKDVEKFITALHSSRKDRTGWRKQLAASFEIEGFIDFLAVNQLISNWDTYGGLAHNYYLYTDEGDEVVSFLPWDFDLSFDGSSTSDLTLRSFDGTWPLIQAIARDVEYATLYQQRLAAVAAVEFDSEKMKKRIEMLVSVIESSIDREDAITGTTKDAFTSGIESIQKHIVDQNKSLKEFLQTQTQTINTDPNSQPENAVNRWSPRNRQRHSGSTLLSKH